MKRILILANNDGGLYHFRFELLRTLKKEYNVICCVPKGKYTDCFTSIGCEVIICEVLDRRGTNPLHDLKLFGFYRRIIHKLQPDVVLSYTIKPNVYGGMACRIKHVKYIANVTSLGTSI